MIKSLLGLLIFFGTFQLKAVENGEVIESAETIALSDFLNEISEKHEVFFTYNPNLLSG